MAGGDAVLFEGVDVSLLPGEHLLVTGPPQARTALLLALTGRLPLTSGELKVLGLALPPDAESRLLSLTPGTYTGLASSLVAHLT